MSAQVIFKTKHGYEVYGPDAYNNLPRLYCRDDKDALEDIREYVESGKTLEVVNDYDTFYGVSWGDWLMKGTEDIATASVVETWDAFGQTMPFPSRIVLVPITK